MRKQHANFSEEPEPVVFYDFNGSTQVVITINVTEHQEEPLSEEEAPRKSWEGDQYIFWEKTDALDKEAALADPEAYYGYVTTEYRQKAKDKAQAHLDYVREHIHRVDVPSYKEGYAVMHTEKDDIYLLAGLLMGGLSYYEFADGQVASPLSPEDIQKIYADLSAHETALQQGKQACWAAIDAAKTEEEVIAALDTYINSNNV